MSDITIAEDIKGKIYSQDYSSPKVIEGVKVITLKTFLSEEGDFGELIRLNQNGELDGIEGVEGFKLAQINRTRLFPNSIKAWHLHFKQDEIWYLPPSDDIMVGLWDVREGATKDVTMRLALGGGMSRMIFIPKGVAHGSANFSGKDINLFYFVNQTFNISDPDEKRIPWDTKGASFWTPARD